MQQGSPILTPRLVVSGAARAIDLYQRIFDAECLERYETEDGRIVHAALSIRGAVLALTDDDGTHNQGSEYYGGSPVILHLAVEDPDAVAAALTAAGGRTLIPIDDRFYGYREGRVADPFDHVWILSRRIEELEPEEIRQRMRGGEG